MSVTFSSIIVILGFITIAISMTCISKSVMAQISFHHTDTGSHASFLTYENSSLGLQIQYPGNWKKVENTGNLTFYSISQNDSNANLPHPQLHILVKPFHNETLTQSANEVVNNYSKPTPAFRLLKLSPANTNGLLSEMILYNYTNPKGEFAKGIDVILTNNESNFYISYKASPKAFFLYLPTIYNMIDSVKILAAGDLGVYLGPMVSSQGPSSRLGVLSMVVPDLLVQLLPTFSKEAIQQYNFNDMTTDDLVNLFSGLSSSDLVKIFDDLPHNEVISLLNKIPVDERSSILNKLPLDKSQQYFK